MMSLLSQTSCSSYLDEDTRGKLTGDQILATQIGLESALTGAYRGWTWTWVYGFTNGWATEMTLGGDDLGCPASTGANTREYDSYAVRSDNSSSASTFWGAYKAIQGANNIIEHYQSTQGDEKVINVIAGEAYFIRALSYFWLVRCYGDIPLILTSKFSAEQLTAEKAPAADIYNLIVSDFQKAETMLTNNRRNNEPGRPNIGSAKAMLAEVYLFMAGWPLKQTEKYALAAEKAKEVIDNRALYGFDLVKDWTILFGNDESSKNLINSEDIMIIPTNKGAEDTANAMNGYWAGPSEINGWEVVYSEYEFFNSFPEGPRKDATFAITIEKEDGTIVPWQNLKTKHPYYKKLMKDRNAPGFFEYSSSIPVRWLRYTQTVLTYAEASTRATGSVNAQAKSLMKEIRDRAQLPEYTTMSADDFAKAVVQERAWELAAERVRWFDMVRLEIVAEVAAKRSPEEAVRLIGDPSNKANYVFPIPEHDQLLNANMNKKPSFLK